MYDSATDSIMALKINWTAKTILIYMLFAHLFRSLSAANEEGRCPSIQNGESEEIFCKLGDSPISCKEPPNNATAVVVCKPFYVFPGHKPVYKCLNGTWDQTFTKCNLECGTKRIGLDTSSVEHTVSLTNEYPWTVAIYNKNDLLICGGTLISEHHVLSGAVCFTNSNGDPMEKNDYTIIAGKYFRNISNEEPGSQRRKVKYLYVHENYRGKLQSYRDDIALIELNEKIIVSLVVQPVCIDWENALEDIDFTNSKMGVFTGWGYTKPQGSPSDVLKKLRLPFQPEDTCRPSLPEEFARKYYTNDKFCAGYINKSVGVCTGDSGGGLYFKSDGMHYFIRGILSLSPRTKLGCDIDQFALYTKVSNYLPWIKNRTEHQ